MLRRFCFRRVGGRRFVLRPGCFEVGLFWNFVSKNGFDQNVLASVIAVKSTEANETNWATMSLSSDQDNQRRRKQLRHGTKNRIPLRCYAGAAASATAEWMVPFCGHR